MIGSGSGVGWEGQRRRENVRALRELAGYEEKDEVRADRGDLIESLGAHGSVTFGFVLPDQAGSGHASRCTAAVTPSEIVLLDDEPSSEAPEIARVPREVLEIALTDPPAGLPSVTLGVPVEGSDEPVEQERVGARVVLRWPAGQIAVGFATKEGASEAVDLLQRKLDDRNPEVSDPGGTMPA